MYKINHCILTDLLRCAAIEADIAENHANLFIFVTFTYLYVRIR